MEFRLFPPGTVKLAYAPERHAPEWLEMSTVMRLCLVLCVVLHCSECSLRLGTHPRLRLLDSEVPALKRSIAEKPTATLVYEQLLAHGQELLQNEPVSCATRGQHTGMPEAARTLLDTVYSLGLLYRITGNETYASRVTSEVLYVCGQACPHWGLTNFLDTAVRATGGQLQSSHASWTSMIIAETTADP